MNNNKILTEIINNKTLKEEYWPDIDPAEFNVDNLLVSDNKYLKSIYYLLREENDKQLSGLYKKIKNVLL